MSRILLTAAGSMSALPAMERYRAMGHEVFACDIYDRSWNVASTLAPIESNPYSSIRMTFSI